MNELPKLRGCLTAAMIRQGQPGDPKRCAMRLSIAQAIEDAGLTHCTAEVRARELFIRYGGTRYYWTLPPEFLEFKAKFDQRKPVKGFPWEIDPKNAIKLPVTNMPPRKSPRPRKPYEGVKPGPTTVRELVA